MTQRERDIIRLIKSEVKPALGCTEPIAVALACAKAMELLRTVCPVGEASVTVEVSGNILKNGMGVGIPGTGMVGLEIAAALGVTCGKSEYGLEVLHDLCPDAVGKARKMLGDGRVEIRMSRDERLLYVKAMVRVAAPQETHTAVAVIADAHDRFIETGVDGVVEQLASGLDEAGRQEEEQSLGAELTVAEIYDFAGTVDFRDIEFILESKTMNLRLAEEGLRGNYGLKVGKTIADKRFEAVYGKDFLSYAMSLTAAASDARMAGCTLPAMSNSGSGNQGITVTMPVIAYALHYGVDDEKLARALALSHLIAIHIKSYLGRLSALCGCVVASTGSSCGLVFIQDGTLEQVCNTIKNMVGNITGMVCDGAKVGCALKVASGVASSVQSAVLALDDTCISSREGIIEDDIEKTIRNLGSIGSVGMKYT
ncbi:MAG: serine dehydratase subunit alpha family protein, partial [Candidatus Cryptobacteroides sp.]